MRHRHTVEQYGVRVEISTKTHRISHSSTRSSLTGRSWPWFESTIRVRVSRCCPHVMHATARRNCQPPFGRDRRMDRICSGVMQQWIPGDTPSTGRRHTGKPLGRPVKALPILLPVSSTPCRSVLCVSLARQPRGWGRRPGSEELGERVGVLQRPPRVLDSPLRLIHQKHCVWCSPCRSE